MHSSRLPGIFKLCPEERVALLIREGWLSQEEVHLLDPSRNSTSSLDRVSENVVGGIGLPLGIVANATVNGLDILVPMATEEPSIVAACSRAALLVRGSGGVTAEPGTRVAGAQVLIRHSDPSGLRPPSPGEIARFAVAAATEHVRWSEAGGRIIDVTLEPLQGHRYLAVITIRFDPADSMGANLADSLGELWARGFLPLESDCVTAIVTNAALGKPATAEVDIPVQALAWKDMPGSVVAERIQDMSLWAQADPRRCVTHNKGVLNGIHAMMTALYQDTRALTVTLLDSVRMPGKTAPLVSWRVRGDRLAGNFCGYITCGTAGGTGPHVPATRVFHRWMNVRSASDLCSVAAAIGLLQNLGALTTLVTEGIQSGHMSLHGRKQSAID